MNNLKQNIFIFLCLLGIQMAYAQKKQDAVYTEQKRIEDFFSNNIPINTTKDSNMVYAFAFKAVVKKDTKGKAQLISLTANDTIAYTIYPKYKFLETINYGLFMKDRKQAIFIFPVLLDIANTTLKSFPAHNRPADNIMSVFFYREGEELDAIENRIYFRPYLLMIDKTIKN